MSRTKIVATIGPASDNEQTIRALLESGMNVARVNFSHVVEEEAAIELVTRLRKVADEIDHTLTLLADLQGPKLRLGKVPGGSIELQLGDLVTLTATEQPDTIPFPHPELYDSIGLGARLVLGDGEVELQVIYKEENLLRCATTVPGRMGSRKGVNMPGTRLPIPSITEKDARDLVTICKLNFDYVALSFVRSAEDIRDLRRLMAELGANIPIIAKIEKSEAIDALLEIRDEADGMMVARGDLGIDLPAQEIPFLQKRIIRACNEVGKPVITATQMLQSMENSPIPTRAEATDVANAILDGTDAVMLSGESAYGKYPIRAVKMMRSIATMAEENFPYHDWEVRRKAQLELTTDSVAEAISSASCGIAELLNAQAIVTNTVSGYTARQVARYRPRTPIIALTPLEETRRRLNLVWGVETVQVPRYDTMDEIFNNTPRLVANTGLYKEGERIIITAGTPYARTGLTNLIQVHEFTAEDFAE